MIQVRDNKNDDTIDAFHKGIYFITLKYTLIYCILISVWRGYEIILQFKFRAATKTYNDA